MRRVVNLRAVLLAVVTAYLTACGGGGGPSNVGDQPDLPPVAVATVIGGGNNNMVRSGSVVLLSTKDSDGQDSPILKTVWQAQDPGVVLEERAANSVAFEAPNVAVPTPFTFVATVFDAEDQTDTVTVTLTVIPAGDLNKFLTVDGPSVGRLTTTSATNFQKFTVRVRPLAANDPVAPGDAFSLTVDAVLNYADRNALCAQAAPNDPSQCALWTNNATLQLASLGYPLTIADVTWNSAGGFATETLVELNTPAIDASLFNQFIIDSLPANADESARDALLDLWRTDSAEITLTIRLVDPAAPIAAAVTVSGPASSTVELGPNDDVTVSQILADASGALAIETAETAAAYYAAIDPDDEFVTLSDWLVARGFATRAADGSVALVPDAVSGAGEFAHAVYTNNYDLGFGRDMYTRIDKANGNVYSYVENYPTLQNAIEGREEFVTVVMDYSPPGGTANNNSLEPKFTKFYVYAVDESTGDQIRVRSIDFDGRGLKYVPGACVTCHGGTVPSKDDALAAGGYANQGDTNSGFFPWDLESFLYSDTDPAIPATSSLNDARTLDDIDPQRRFTRSAQEDQFRKLNMAALATYVQHDDPLRFAAAEDLVRLFYPGDVPPTLPSDCVLDDPDACLVGSFTDGAVPAGWADQAELYTEVHARHCRACHTQLAPDTLLQFTTSTSFLDHSPFDLVFRTGVMPMARVTMDRLWAGTDKITPPIEVFRRVLFENGKGDFTGVVPGAPIPAADFVAAANTGSIESSTTEGATFVLTKTGRTVTMTGADSLFFDMLDWSLTAQSDDSDFPVCLQDPTALQDDGETAFLSPTLADDYCVALTASRVDYPGVTAAPLLIRAVDDRPTFIQASNCGGTFDGTTCVSVDEFVAGAAKPDVLLSAQLITDPAGAVEIGSDRLMTTLLALRDQDQLDGLDALADFVIAFTSSPSAGSAFLVDPGTGVFAQTARTSFGLDELVTGKLKYQSDWDNSEIVAIPTIDPLSFEVLYPGAGGSAVASGTAQVLILPKSDSAPTLTIVDAANASFTNNAVSVPFNGSVSGSFRVTDDDFGETVLAFTRLSGTPTLGVLSNETAATVLTTSTEPPVSTGSFTYTAGDAEALETANATLFNCKAGGGFAVGAEPQNTLTYRVTTGTALPGESDSQNLTINLAPSVADTTDTGALGSALNALYTSGASGGPCANCHSTTTFSGANFAAAARTGFLFNAAVPGDSRVLTDRNHSNFKTGGIIHTGGTYTAAPIVRTWVFECAP